VEKLVLLVKIQIRQTTNIRWRARFFKRSYKTNCCLNISVGGLVYFSTMQCITITSLNYYPLLHEGRKA